MGDDNEKRRRAQEMQDMAEMISRRAGTHKAIVWLAMQIGSLMHDRDKHEKHIKNLERQVERLKGHMVPSKLR